MKKRYKIYFDKLDVKEKLIDVQEEAFYRAIKRIEQENEQSSIETENIKNPWYMEILSFINVILFPWNINKRFRIREDIYDSILVIFISLMLKGAGSIIWLLGIFNFIAKIKLVENLISIVVLVSSTIMILSIGSVFILSGREFEKEDDGNKIYAYSASIIALVGLLIAIFL